jgi:sugar/nucleoside kinase (ribokinase family)
MDDERPLIPLGASRTHDLLCVGTALVDHLAYAPHEHVGALGLNHGTMSLVEGEHAARIRSSLPVERAVSGGTVANTAVGVAALGARPAYLGAVASDELGERFAADLDQSGVHAVLERPERPDEHTGTGACYVIVTPDQQRTMATTLGVAGLLSAEFLDRSGLVASSSLVYFDGYLLDFPDSRRIVESLLAAASDAGTRVAFGLADPFCVARHLEEMREITERVDLVFANEEEAIALSGTSGLEHAIDHLRHERRTTAVTLGERGAVISTPEGEVEIEVHEVDEVHDTTGAGDLFAAGVLYGAIRQYGARRAGALGALCAAEAIGHLGARPERDLAELASRSGLL